MTRPALPRAWLAAALVAAAGCGDTLLDRYADPTLIGPYCGPGLVACLGECLACSPPANASAACSASGCDFTCNDGFNRCGGGPSCTAEGPTSCGPFCSDCSAGVPANAVPVCTAAHACDFACSPGWLRSGPGCVRATAVSAGYLHTCALLADGKVRCWGANWAGQLGNGTAASSDVPVDVAFPPGAPLPAVALVSGYAHACAILSDQTLWCWGDNTFGEIGDGSGASQPTPVRVPGLSGVVAVGAGGGVLPTVPLPTSFGHTCAVLTGGALWCWGANGSGQIGDGGTATRVMPAQVTALPAGAAVDQVACGERHTCARVGGAVYCWGANDSGQLGIAPLLTQTSPATATIASGATALASGLEHACAVASGGLLCWGLNSSGQVDAGDTANGTEPAPVAPALGGGGAFQAATLAAGRAHTCAARTGEAPKCFGANGSLQLGAATVPAGNGKTDVPMLAPPIAAALTAGSDHSCTLTSEGGIQCWGGNGWGQLGTGGPGTPAGPSYVSGR